MSVELDQIYQEGVERGIADGELKKARETVISLSEMGLPVEKIAQAVKVNIQTVQEWLTESMGETR